MAEKAYTLSRKARNRLQREGYSRSGVRGPFRGEYMDNIKDKGERNAEARSADDYGRGGAMSHLASVIYEDRYKRKPGPRTKPRSKGRQ